MITKLRVLAPGVLLAASACGGGDSAGERAGSSAAPPRESPGGIWHAAAGPEASMTLLISESGELMMMGAGPSFGAGAVTVNDGNAVTGAYTVRTLSTDPFEDVPGSRNCDLEGTVDERVSLQITVTCEAGANADESERRVSLVYDASYESGSSLESTAGNYTLPFDADSNILTISDDGGVFGMYSNGGIDCTVNGTAGIIDPDYSLLRFELTFSSCDGLASTAYEGATMSGLGWPDPPASPDASILIMLSELLDERFELVSVLYERA